MSLTQLFCDADDFCETFIPQWEAKQIESGEKKRRKKRCLSPSEINTVIVYYHQTGYTKFKWFYQRHLLKKLIKALPKSLKLQSLH